MLGIEILFSTIMIFNFVMKIRLLGFFSPLFSIYPDLSFILCYPELVELGLGKERLPT